MSDPHRILLTGHKGYIGSVMAPILVNAGHDVVGYDTGYFSDCTLVPDGTTLPELQKDIRDVAPADLKGFDTVIHLAALSNDPIGNIDEGWTTDINHDATVRLAELAREAGVGRFLFSSSCIMYGMSDGGVVDETSPLDPQTEYARSKVKSEAELTTMASDSFSPVYIRNGTIYGVSPRMRFDTVLNNLVGAAYTSGTVKVLSDGKPWRPVLHVEDVCRSFMNIMDAPRQDIHNQAFNNGADHLNHQVIELAQMAVDAVPGATLEVLNEPSADQRTYKASFAKFARTFPDFEWKWTARTGAQDLSDTFEKVGLTAEQYSGKHFTRLKWLNHLLDENKLDRNLRWT
ncbi:NAD-dependent epimerase/dehydratase family protein [Oceanibium sediminis]|uniref:NAD-dependent epimerase/dehydratase family protein n=1 Tax=Oceanibium sediminis TaxID=2026339 RepID=UPI000DD47672|nr:SDR family oxidoreductase [Oceanibium sediminis]